MLKNFKISACLVVRNEEKNIRKCLDSIKTVVAEIIIVHDGPCQDKTIEISQEYTDLIFIREYAGICELHYPFVFQKASGDWILKIDADEFLSVNLKKELMNLADQNKVDAYAFLWVWYNSLNQRYFRKENRYKTCFLRKEKMYFLGLPHNPLLTEGSLKKNNLILGHVYRKQSFRIWFKNNYRWAKIHAEYLLKDFNELPAYQAQREDWLKKRPVYLKAPLFFLPLKIFKTIFERIFKEHILNNPTIGLQKLILDGVFYQFFLCWNLWKLKHFKK
ncbi:MAG: glycosyltransferase [Patescibacteria group bacterium]|jgi:glycosyltransferase involved in cell wall biosynthesis